MNKNIIIVGIIASALVVAMMLIVGVGGNDQSSLDKLNSLDKKVGNLENSVVKLGKAFEGISAYLGSGSRFTNGISADSTSPSAGEVRGTTLTSTGAVTFGGAATLSSTLAVTGETTLTATTTAGVMDVSEFTQGGGCLTLTDANGGAYTLTSDELINNNVFVFAAGGASQAVIALTFPATSTLSAIIPNAGDMREWIYDASALATATTTTMTAGTGMDLYGYTTDDDVIDGAEIARITCWRQASTDISCITSELVASD